MPRSTTAATRLATAITAIALLAGCSSPAAGPGNSASDAASTPGPATPTADPRDQLTELLLTASDFPLAGYRVEQDFVIPSAPSTTPPPTVSQGTAMPTEAPETICTGDFSTLSERPDAQGVARLFASTGIFAEAIYLDESGKLAESLQNQIEECIAQGPVRPAGYNVDYSWRTDGVPQAGGTYTAQFSSGEPDSTDITMISIGHTGAATLVAFAATKQLSTNISLEDYDTMAASAFAKLSA